MNLEKTNNKISNINNPEIEVFYYGVLRCQQDYIDFSQFFNIPMHFVLDKEAHGWIGIICFDRDKDFIEKQLYHCAMVCVKHEVIGLPQTGDYSKEELVEKIKEKSIKFISYIK